MTVSLKRKYNKLVNETRRYFKKAGAKKAVIGLSGGVDSALSLKIAADAIGNKNVTALLMPETSLTEKEDMEDAAALCSLLDVPYKTIRIDAVLRSLRKFTGIKQNKNSWINLKPRVRMLLLYNYANANNALVVGTSNKTELRLGYFTKYGDGGCDLEVIGDLYKTEVWEMAGYLKLPPKIINKTPSAGLYRGQSDEKEIGASYEEIDRMLKGKKPTSPKIKRMIERNKHKTAGVAVMRVSEK